MFKKFFQQLKFKLMARQLRKPGGAMGNKVGLMMNKANAFLYDFALQCMNPSPGEKILEIGFGNGHFFNKVFSSAESLQLSGLDFSPTMVEAAMENNSDLLASGKLELHYGSSDKMPFADNSFDKIYCIINRLIDWDCSV